MRGTSGTAGIPAGVDPATARGMTPGRRRTAPFIGVAVVRFADRLATSHVVTRAKPLAIGTLLE